MQASGRVKIVRHVLAENTTLHELYHHVQLELVGPITFILENPNFLSDKDGEFGFVCQLTPSGTLDFKFIPDPPEVDAKTQEERDRAAAKESLQNKATSHETTQFTEEQIKQEVERLKKEREESEKNRVDTGTSLGAASPIKSELTASGEFPEDKKASEKSSKLSTTKKPTAKKK